MYALHHIRNFISENNWEQVFPAIQSILCDTEWANDSLLITSQYHSLQEKMRQGILSQEQTTLESNRITARVLELLNAYESALEKELQSKALLNSELDTLSKLLRLLDMSLEAYKVQRKLALSLIARIKRRLGDKEWYDLEAFFTLFYDKMTEDEIHIHTTIRGYTEKIMYAYNVQALEIIQLNERRWNWRTKIPSMELLEEHLVFWKAKYEVAFETSPEMCFVFVHKHEGKGFPDFVEDEIEDYIAQKSRSAA